MTIFRVQIMYASPFDMNQSGSLTDLDVDLDLSKERTTNKGSPKKTENLVDAMSAIKSMK
jgi:hypothetical protein